MQTIYWDEEQLTTSVSTGFGANNRDVGPPYGVYVCNFAERFTNITVPQGATIVSATYFATVDPSLLFTFETFGTGNPLPATRRIRVLVSADDADNSSTLTGETASGMESRTRTTANTSVVQIEDGTSSRILGATDMLAVNVTSQIQEVVNRTGWSSGNALTLLTDDNGSDSGDEGTAFSWGVAGQNALNSLTIIYS